VSAADSHTRTVDAFSAYLEGELPPEEKASLEHHLATCIQCRTSLERFRRTLGGLGRLKRTAAPYSFLADIQQQINRRSRGRFFRRTLGGLGMLKQTSAPNSFLEAIPQQIHRRSRGRFFRRRWLLFGRIPFEWLSLAMIVAMLVYYIVVLQSSPTGVKPIPP
jgi:anti-sigma factor RsiW